MKKYPAIKHLALTLLVALIATLLWSNVVNGWLFFCSDSIPILDFIPPFVHGSDAGDYFIAPKEMVWVVWLLFVAAILVVPFVIIRVSSAQLARKPK